MHAAIDARSLAESAANHYSDLDTVRRRLIDLEKNRIFSDEELELLLRKSVTTNLKADFDHRMLNHKMRRSASDRTSSGRVVIRSWTPAALEMPENEIGEPGQSGWKQFQALTETRQPKAMAQSVKEDRNIKRPTKLKRMQNRNFVITFLANLIFIPKKACSSIIGLVLPSSRSAC